MAGKNLLRKALPSLDNQAGCACLSPGERDLTGDSTGTDEQDTTATLTSGAKRRCPLQPGDGVVFYRRVARSADISATERRDRNGHCKR